MSSTLLYRAENAEIRLDLVKHGDSYEVAVSNSGEGGSQTFKDYRQASNVYQILCNSAQLTAKMMDKPARTALVLLNEMRVALTHYPTRSQEVISKYANDPEVQEHRSELRSLATHTDLNDSLIRSMCTQLDREVKAREKVQEQETYVANDLYGAF